MRLLWVENHAVFARMAGRQFHSARDLTIVPSGWSPSRRGVRFLKVSKTVAGRHPATYSLGTGSSVGGHSNADASSRMMEFSASGGWFQGDSRMVPDDRNRRNLLGGEGMPIHTIFLPAEPDGSRGGVSLSRGTNENASQVRPFSPNSVAHPLVRRE
jgi:hypothetical protein